MLTIKEQAKKKVEYIAGKLINQKFDVGSIEEKKFNYEFTIKRNNHTFKTQVYFGKKGVKIVLQGNKELDEFNEIQNIVLGNYELNFKKTELREPEAYVGSDETGKGDFFGPLVVAAVYVNKHTSIKLKKIGVRDSKELKENQISSLAYKIKEIIQDAFRIVFIRPAKYNKLYGKFNNLNTILNWAHSRAIENLLNRFTCDTIIIDKFSNKELDIEKKLAGKNYTFTHIPKAEKFTAVAAASIIARDAMDKWFIKNKINGMPIPKGASKEVEDFARHLISRNGETILSDIAKLHFKTFKKVKL